MNYFDVHCDTLSALENNREGYSLFDNDLHVCLNRETGIHKRAQFFAIFASGHKEFEKHFNAQYDYFIKQTKDYSDLISLCRCSADIHKAVSDGKIAALLSIEGAETIGCSIYGLRKAHLAGVRAINITWNRANELSGTCVEDSCRGLSVKGYEFVRECGKLGIIVDVSHLSERGFWDVAGIAVKPFIASHSNSASVFPHKRNLTDEQFKTIIRHGGIAGINLYTEFLGGNSVSDAVKHIMHFLELGGEDNIAIGADFDGCSSLPEGICCSDDIRKLYDALADNGISQMIIDKIFFDNMIGVVERICDT